MADRMVFFCGVTDAAASLANDWEEDGLRRGGRGHRKEEEGLSEERPLCDRGLAWDLAGRSYLTQEMERLHVGIGV